MALKGADEQTCIHYEHRKFVFAIKVCSVNNPIIKKSASVCIVQVSYSYLMLSISLHCRRNVSFFTFVLCVPH